jgi:hypothetical protein
MGSAPTGLSESGALLRTEHAILADETTDMANSVPLPPPGFDQLSVDEQIDYVQSLWDRIAASSDQVPVPNGIARSSPNASRNTTAIRTRARVGTWSANACATNCVSARHVRWHASGPDDN